MIAGKAALPPISEPASTSFRLMASAARDFVCVDMRGMKAALLERAASRGVSVPQVVREIVVSALATPKPSERGPIPTPGSDTIKMSIRFSAEGARRLSEAAAAMGCGRGLFVERLMSSAPLHPDASPARQRAALVQSNAELAALIRQISHLRALLKLGSVSAALEYADMLSGLRQEVKNHLKLAGEVLAEMRRRPSSPGRRADDPQEKGHVDGH